MNGQSDLVQVSTNQLQTTVLKACVGADVARGVAEDVGEGCVVLAHSSISFLPELLNLIRRFDPLEQPAKWSRTNDGWIAQSVCALREGPSFVDLAVLGNQASSKVDGCMIQLGLVLARQMQDDVTFDVHIEDSWIAASDIRAVDRLSSNFALRLSKKQLMKPTVLEVRPVVSLADWEQLQKFADEILVPADDTNRADAGAGLTDND